MGALLSTALTTLIVASGAAHAQALPNGGSVASGSASIASDGTTTTITQSSDRAIVNWTSFDVGANHGVVFAQPNAQSATLNRVTGATTSTIAGSITSNGAVYLVNPNGIAITPTGSVRTGGGFVASTLGISDADFNAGRLSFAGSGTGSVSNAGHLRASQGAYVALLGGLVSNSGTISVPLGKVGLGAGEQATLDLNGDGFMQVAAPVGLSHGIDMSGTITAAGGRVELRAASVIETVRNVVNLSGAISADSATGDGGSILLLAEGGTVTAGGTLTARATGASGNGGSVETSGARVDFTGLRVDTSAAHGRTGSWLVDPTDLTVDASAAVTISSNLATSNVTLQTNADGSTSGPGTTSAGNGDINIDQAIGWTSENTLTLNAYNNINLNAVITGYNGGLTLIAGGGVPNTGAINATGGVNIGTFTLTNGNWSQVGASLPSFSAIDFGFDPANASFLRATGGDGTIGTPYTLTDIYGLQGMASSTLLASNFALANSVDAFGTGAWNGGAGFVPIGTDGNGNGWDGASFSNGGTTGHSGTFDGGGYAITELTIDRPTAFLVGLFGVSTGTLRNVNLTDALVTGSDQTGMLLGFGNGATVSGSMASGEVNGGNATGGLIGYEIGTVSQSSASGLVTGNFFSGGLIGNATGATVDQTYASVDVLGDNYVGGLIGYADGTNVSRSYATGPVAGTDLVGGLIGTGVNGTTLSQNYATGAVSGTGSSVGGFVGDAGDLVIDASNYWDSFSTGQAAGYGTIGSGTFSGSEVTSDPAQSAATNYAFSTGAYGNFTASDWIFFDGQTRPFGAWEAVAPGGTILNAHQLQLIGRGDAASLSGNYTLGNDIELGETGANLGTAETSSGMWAATGWVPIGTDGNGNAWDGSAFTGSGGDGFSGTLDGTGHVIAGLTIDRPGSNQVGLIGFSSGTIQNVNLVHAFVSGNALTGALLGFGFDATVSGSTASGTVSGSLETGGLIGGLQGGQVSQSSASGSVSGGLYTGGLIGSTSLTTIDQSYASAGVLGGDFAGGLIGIADGGSVSRSYATGYVDGTNSVGGLLGAGIDAINVSQSYATGSVTGTGSAIGGFIGDAGDGVVDTSNYWDSFSTGQTAGYGTIGSGTFDANAVTSDPTQSAAANYAFSPGAYANFTASDWVFFDGTRPFGAWEAPTPGGMITNSHQLQLIGANGTTLAGSYTLANDIDLSETGANFGTAETSAGMWGPKGFVPIGTDGTGNVWNSGTGTFNALGIAGFSGTLDGNFYTIGEATILRPDANNAGLFGWTTGTIKNLAVADLTVTGKTNVGGLTGYLYNGRVSDVFVTTTLDGINGVYNVGGAIGLMYKSDLAFSLVGASVTGTKNVGGAVGFEQDSTISEVQTQAIVSASAAYAGGLVGYQLNGTVNTNVSASGLISAPYGAGGLSGIAVGFPNPADPTSTTASTTNGAANVQVFGTSGTGGLVGFLGYGASIDQSYSIGFVGGDVNAGGLVGYAFNSSITDSYSTAFVIGTDGTGGLVGVADGGTIARTFAGGAVSGSANAGGLIGKASNNPTVTASVWDTDTTGLSTSAGGSGATGYTTSELQDNTTYLTIYAGWDFTTIWNPPGSGQYPSLQKTP